MGRFEQELPCLGFSFTEAVLYSVYPSTPSPLSLPSPPSPNHPSAQIMNKYIVQLFVSFHSIIVMLSVAKQAETQACDRCV